MTRYNTIVAALKEKILRGEYGDAAPLPSERALVRKFAASRNAVRHAIDELEKAKLVRRHHGRRTEVVYGSRRHRIGLIPCVADSEFFQPLALEMSELCEREGYALLFAATGVRVRPGCYAADAAERVYATARDFVAQRVSGVLFQPVSFLPDAEAVNAKVLGVFAAAKIPVVLLDYDAVLPPKRSDYDLVGIDNVSASLSIVDHLVGAGARKIHFFRRPNCSNVVTNRMRGVALGAMLHGLDWGPKSVLSCELEDTAEIARHLSRRNRPDAIVCGFDTMALKVREVARSLGIDVPRQLMIAGFDDSQGARMMRPGLTTIHQPCMAIAQAAFRRLQARMLDPNLKPVDILLRAPLVVRDSTKRDLERKNRK